MAGENLAWLLHVDLQPHAEALHGLGNEIGDLRGAGFVEVGAVDEQRALGAAGQGAVVGEREGGEVDIRDILGRRVKGRLLLCCSSEPRGQ